MVQQNITPWSVKADRAENKTASIDYDHIISHFGCQKITDEDLNKVSSLCKNNLHKFFKRNLVFAHRSLNEILESINKGEKFFLYTGRGPSSTSMHLGHSIPFILCKYLQDQFKVPIVIQITDDEKFLCKNMSFEEIRKCAHENIKDIIAYGFDEKLTYIFSNYKQGHLFYKNTLKISKEISLNDVCKVFGFNNSTNIGMIEFPAKQIAAAFGSSFKFLKKGTRCLIPCAVDQDPYFRLARDIAHKLDEPKPSTIYVRMLPDLQGTHQKMSASDKFSAIYLNDDMDSIKKKINKYAFSGGKETIEMHKELGGDTDIDVAYQYLRFFLEDDDELKRLEEGYQKGEIGSGFMKKRCIEVIQNYVKGYQEIRGKVTNEIVNQFMNFNKFDE